MNKPASYIFVLVTLAGSLGLATTSCAAAPAESEVGTSEANLDSRFDPSYPAPFQQDAWSCSVHTTTWMLRATGHPVTWNQISSHMLATGRVTTHSGLSDANGPGLAATLRDFANGAQDIQNKGVASFDEVAARAGHMAVGIGGRAWNHWSAVRGYDANRDVILLANSSAAFRNVGQELTRGEFAALGAMAMVWMDFGQTPAIVPFEPSPKPNGGPFPALHVKGPIDGGQWLTQCHDESADLAVERLTERVWQTDGTGPDSATRWAPAMYPQTVNASCGEPSERTYPVVLRNLAAGEFGGWITLCSGEGDGFQRVFRIEGEVDGHPAARFLYNEPAPDCE